MEKTALETQIGGSHYKSKAIQPVEYIHANNIGYFEGCVIKYVTRWKNKNGIQDLEKAKHYLELLIELEKANETRI
jgi:bbp48